MKPFRYYNPVRIEFGSNKLDTVSDFIGGRKALLVTTSGFVKSGLADRLRKQTDRIVMVIDEIEGYPTFALLKPIYERVWKNDIQVIIAVGGGSVMDSAKVLSVYRPGKDWNFVNDLIRNKIPKKDYLRIPIISVPTTTGTGSELTPWSTVWDMDAKEKYSLHLPDLWSETCIGDPVLTWSLPKEITVQTGLDALSQSLEAIWNKNANPVSTQYAIEAAKDIMETLPLLTENPSSPELRERMMKATLFMGLAFSNTQTAIAHAISYYITAHKGTPHGIACSLTLPDIVDTVIGQDPEIDHTLTQMFGELSSRPLRRLFDRLSVSVSLKDYGVASADLAAIRKTLDENPRANNSLVDTERLFFVLHSQL